MDGSSDGVLHGGSSPVSVAVVGAGLAGVACARGLQAAGVEVTVFDKSRGVGGRLATRRTTVTLPGHAAPWWQVQQQTGPVCAIAAAHQECRAAFCRIRVAPLRWIVPNRRRRAGGWMHGSWLRCRPGWRQRGARALEDVRRQWNLKHQVTRRSEHSGVNPPLLPKLRECVVPIVSRLVRDPRGRLITKCRQALTGRHRAERQGLAREQGKFSATFLRLVDITGRTRARQEADRTAMQARQKAERARLVDSHRSLRRERQEALRSRARIIQAEILARHRPGLEEMRERHRQAEIMADRERQARAAERELAEQRSEASIAQIERYLRQQERSRDRDRGPSR